MLFQYFSSELPQLNISSSWHTFEALFTAPKFFLHYKLTLFWNHVYIELTDIFWAVGSFYGSSNGGGSYIVFTYRFSEAIALKRQWVKVWLSLVSKVLNWCTIKINPQCPDFGKLWEHSLVSKTPLSRGTLYTWQAWSSKQCPNEARFDYLTAHFQSPVDPITLTPFCV